MLKLNNASMQSNLYEVFHEKLELANMQSILKFMRCIFLDRQRVYFEKFASSSNDLPCWSRLYTA